MIPFELFFSKSNGLPAIFFNGKVHVAEDIQNYGCWTIWKHKPKESPSWVIAGLAEEIEVVEEGKLILIKPKFWTMGIDLGSGTDYSAAVPLKTSLQPKEQPPKQE